MRALYNLLRLKYRTGSVTYKGRQIKVYLADSFPKMMFGLMYWERLDKDKGMLFKLLRPSREATGIWMLNMKFPIDIIWIGGDGRVVDIKRDAEPCQSIFRCSIYRPRESAKYILELNAGYSRKLGIKLNERIILAF